jgi:hypothetical protein
MHVVHTITTPWAPYSLMFSRDGTRLAIGGGSWYGNGGILLASLASRETRLLPCEPLPARHMRREGVPTVSGVCFSPDDRHLAASTWSSGHHPSLIFLFEVSGLDLERCVSLGQHYLGAARNGFPTGVLFRGGHVVACNQRVALIDAVSVWRVPRQLKVGTEGDLSHLTSSRVVIARGKVITGHEAGLVSVPLEVNSHEAEALPVMDSLGVTALGALPSGEGFLTGGPVGELDLWSWNGRWQQRQLRDGTNNDAVHDPELDIVWATYNPNSIVGLCHLPDGNRWVSVSAGGQVCLWNGTTLAATWQVPEPGSPRSLAAHPDRPWIAVGVKKGGFGRPQSAVVIVEVDHGTLDPTWRTPTVLALARAANEERVSPDGPLDPARLAILADALEDVGCADGRVLAHLRTHDGRLHDCWIVASLLGKEVPG